MLNNSLNVITQIWMLLLLRQKQESGIGEITFSLAKMIPPRTFPIG